MAQDLKKTSLYDSHVEHKGRLIHFANYLLPVQYESGMTEEHSHVREKCGLFDVSHMGQIIFEGENLPKLFEQVTPSFFQKMKVGSCKYTALLNEKGGIIDDLIISRLSDNRYLAVFNGSRKEIDLEFIYKNKIEEFTTTDMFETHSLIAIQGPLSLEIVSKLFPEAADLGYMKITELTHPKYENIILSRTGYTGEFGFEVSIKNQHAKHLWDTLLENKDVKPIGLGARDSLRLEVGFPLYGNDLTDKITPVEARIEFIISKNNTTFNGHETVLAQLASGAKQHRCGIEMIDKGVIRKGYEIFKDGKNIGYISSGCYSPTLSKSVGNCYIDSSVPPDSDVEIEIRSKKYKAKLCNMLFYQSKVR